jgi:hypothetical protein
MAGKMRPRKCPLPKHDRPHVQTSVMAVFDDVVLPGQKLRLLATVDVSNHKNRWRFRCFCRENGIWSPVCSEDGKFVPVQDHGSGACVYDCVGTFESLELLTKHELVIDWDVAMSGSVGRNAAGGGPERVRSSSTRSKSSGPRGGDATWWDTRPALSRETYADMVRAGVAS